MRLTDEAFQEEMFPLKSVALENMCSMRLTDETSQEERLPFEGGGMGEHAVHAVD